MATGACSPVDSSVKNGPSITKREKIVLEPEEYKLRKRLPGKCPCRPVDVYITRKTPFVAQLKRCKKLLDSGHERIYLHGLGAAVHRAIHLALQLKEHYYGSVDLEVTTDTVNLVDDVIPEQDDLEPKSQSRCNSAVHITVFRPAVPADPT
ncbi:ribonucleases P/MRP protein subunit pop7 [Chamberlinius hualienensis]